jgi:hypothetical protein
MSTEIEDIEEIARQAYSGEEVAEHFTGHFQASQRIDIALPLELLRSIDAECQLKNISRQDWIKAVCAEKICDAQSARLAPPVNGRYSE